jgi:hypothetical protein
VSDATGGGNGAQRPQTAMPPVVNVVLPPLVMEVDRLLASGQNREAVLVAYLTAEEHLRQVFRINLPHQWTHREFLRRYLRADMGPAGVLLTRLYRLFEPVRFGPAAPVTVDGLSDLVRALYREPALRNTHLYLYSTLARVPADALVVPATAPTGTPPG